MTLDVLPIPGKGGINDQTCLLEAILAHIQHVKVNAEVTPSLLATMPNKGDTYIPTANKSLTKHDMVLKRVTKICNLGGSKAFHLLQQHSCALVVHISLYDLKDPSLFASHFVVWDGDVIHERPKSVRVNNSTHCIKEHCDDVFDRLYHKKRHSHWHIKSM